MFICVMRHGDAEPKGVLYPQDALRPLSDAGRDQVAWVAAGLYALDARFDTIISSPYLRARQTAEIMADGLDHHGPILFEEYMLGEALPQNTAREIAALHTEGPVLLVGHLPHVNRLLAYFISHDDSTKISMQTASIAWVQATSPTSRAGILHWLVPAGVWR
ncbi:MAG: phosphohistidine phosphatase SixA [Candidatus Sumerlaeia bacterium]